MRAAVSWMRNADSYCGIGDYALNQALLTAELPGYALGSMPTSPPKLFWLTRAANGLSYRTATSFADGCGNDYENRACHTAWTPSFPVNDDNNGTWNGYVVGGSAPTPFPPAAVGYTSSAGQPHLIVFETVAGHLRYTVTNSGGSWSTLQTLAGDDVAAGPPTAVLWNNVVRVYAPNALGQLRWWSYTPATNAWAGPYVAYDSSFAALSVVPSVGAAVASGYVVEAGTTATAELALAFTGLDHRLRFGTMNPSTDAWTVQSGPDTFETYEQPGLAYEPFDLAIPGSGRFYLSWNQHIATKLAGTVRLAFTQGNRRASSGARRLVWSDDASLGPDTIASTVLVNLWQTARGNAPLLFRVGFDNNLRGAWSFEKDEDGQNRSTFAPELDGIYTGTMNDMDDRVVTTNNLACSLQQAPDSPVCQ